MIDYALFYAANCKSAESDMRKGNNFQTVLNKTKSFISGKDCPDMYKLFFGDYLFRKMYMYYRPIRSEYTITCKQLFSPVTFETNILAKGSYLKWHNIEPMMVMVHNFIEKRFEDTFFVLQFLNDGMLYRYSCYTDWTRPQMMRHFLDWLKETPLDYQKSNIIDILLRWAPQEPEVQETFDAMRFDEGENTEKTFYNDRQNAHDCTIQESGKRGAIALIKFVQDTRDELEEDDILATFKHSVESLFPDDPTIPQRFIDRIELDSTVFIGDEETFTIKDLALSLMVYISLSPHRDTLYGVLAEEMADMVDYCASGYVVRLVNVLQGFDDRFKIEMSNSSRMQAHITRYLAEEFGRATDAVIDGMTETSFSLRKPYLEFVSNIMTECLPTFYREFTQEDMKKDFVAVLEKTTGWALWAFNSEKVWFDSDI